jgi:hypothetical protein
VELAPRDERSPSNSGTSYSGAGGSSGAPEGRFEESVEEYVQLGCSEGSFNSPLGSGSNERRPDVRREAAVTLLCLVEGLAFLFGLTVFAFRRLDVHHNCRSSAREDAIELRELVTEGVAECSERSFAMRSLRSPTFSVSGSVQERSAENITKKEKTNEAWIVRRALKGSEYHR